jgi:hypothetical protein
MNFSGFGIELLIRVRSLLETRRLFLRFSGVGAERRGD